VNESKILIDYRNMLLSRIGCSLVLVTAAMMSGPATISAAEPTRFVFIADSGNEDSGAGTEKKVADMIKAWKPEFIVAAGDLAYEKGSDTVNVFKGDPITCYGDYIKSPAEDPKGTKTRFFPALGNHEYTAAGGGTNPTRLKFYAETFAVPPGEGGHHYYEVAMGPVHIFILDSNKETSWGGWETGSKQHQWFQKQVPKAGEKWKFAVYHHSAWTSGKSHDSDSTFMRKWNFETSGITASIAGHSHVYERVMKGSFPFFTTGLSGVGAYPFVDLVEGSKVRLGKDVATMNPAPKKKNGALFCEATKETLVMEFWTISGEMADRWPEGAAGLTRKPTKP
jgi:hypothetical protein